MVSTPPSRIDDDGIPDSSSSVLALHLWSRRILSLLVHEPEGMLAYSSSSFCRLPGLLSSFERITGKAKQHRKLKQ